MSIDTDMHLGGIVAGDPEAFGRWVAGAEPRLRDSLRSLATRVDVESVLQEALLRLWQVAPRLVPDGRPDSLLRLGVRVARNLAIDELRRTRQPDLDRVGLEALEHEVPAALVDGGGPDPLLRRLIALCRDKLKGKPALAFAERLASGGADRDEDLAERLGMRLNTFLQNFGRARKQLVECLQRGGVSVDEAGR